MFYNIFNISFPEDISLVLCNKKSTNIHEWISKEDVPGTLHMEAFSQYNACKLVSIVTCIQLLITSRNPGFSDSSTISSYNIFQKPPDLNHLHHPESSGGIKDCFV